jgi:hypothetical protein
VKTAVRFGSVVSIQRIMRIIMDLSGLSIIELKQMLARVNHDLKMNKPTIKRKSIKKAIIEDNEYIVANKIAANFTGNKALPPSDNDKLKADIAIQRDILEFINNGGNIITRKTRKKIKPLTVFGAYTAKVSL